MTGESGPVGGVFKKSKMSFPPVNALPAPDITTTLMSKSPLASVSALDRSEYIAGVSAFFFSGRSKVRWRTWPTLLVEIFVVISAIIRVYGGE